MTQYLLSVYGDEAVNAATSPEDMERMFAQVGAFNKEVQEAGAWVFAGGLHPTSTATVIRPTGDDVLVTDGPFAEAKEVLGGFWIIEAKDLDEALAWAKKGAVACGGPVEVRPFQDV